MEYHNTSLLLTAWSAWSSPLGLQMAAFLLSCLLPVSCGCLSVLCLLTRTSIPFMKEILLPRTPPSNTITLGISASTHECWGHAHIQCIASTRESWRDSFLTAVCVTPGSKCLCSMPSFLIPGKEGEGGTECQWRLGAICVPDAFVCIFPLSPPSSAVE